MPLYFITGNKNKCAEIQAIVPGVEQLDIDLPEIQDIDAKNIIKAKLEAAFEHEQAEFIVEDTSLCLDCLNGLPGPFIKWFLKAMGNDGLYQLTQKLGDSCAQAKDIIGYAKNRQEIYFFEGIIPGQIVAPAGAFGFGWDPIFQPDGCAKTFAQMTAEEKNQVSHRKLAANQLKEYLKKT